MAFIMAVDTTTTITLNSADRLYVPEDVDIITSLVSISSGNGNVSV